MKHRVVVTGMGAVTPNATGLSDFENALREGRSGIRFIPKLEELNFSCRIGGTPEPMADIGRRSFNPKLLSQLSDSVGYAAIAAMEAWMDAGLGIPDQGAPVDWESGTVFGHGICDMDTIASTIVPLVNGGKVRRLGSRVVEKVMGSGNSARIAGLLGLGNQATSNSSACSTGTEAIVEAAMKIRMGLAKRMVAGGAEGASPYTWGGFDAMRVLSRKYNDRPEKGSRPMSASACGFVPGAGAGALVLEALDSARERDTRIYAEVLGIKVNCGGQRGGGSMTAPNPEGVQRCIRGAILDAGISSEDIDLINGHLSATFADPYEVENWSSALERGPQDFPRINSTKSMIGHCLGAAGAIETVAAVLQLHKGFIHASLNCEDPHPDLAPYAEAIPHACLEAPELKTVAKASFGFGDVNSCLILRKWEAEL